MFEEHAPFINDPGAAAFVKAFNERAAKAGIPYTERGDAGRGVVDRMADARSGRDGDQEP